MKKRSLHTAAPQLRVGEGSAKDLAFLSAWEDGILPRSIDAATILRVRQIRRAKIRRMLVEPAPKKRPAGL